MKIKRFVAPDMRQAMREVREEQGPDAVILSTRRIDEGIEIIAAVDYDEALVREAARHGAAPAPAVEPPALPPRAAAANPPPPPPPVREARVETLAPANRPSPAEAAPRAAQAVTSEEAHKTARPEPRAPRAATGAQAEGLVQARAQAPQPQQAPETPAEPVVHPLIERAAQDTVRMRAELSSLREMLEMQLSSLDSSARMRTVSCAAR